jgi:hypothetical protein
MGATLTTVSSLLKEIYESPLREQLNNDVVALRRLEKTSDGVTSDTGGKYVTFPIHYKRNAGVGARLEGETLPVAGNQSTTTARVGLKYLYGAVGMSGQTFELANTNPQAFMSSMDLELNGLKTDLAVDLNRQVYGNGIGAVAVINNAATSNSMTVKSTVWLQDGMQVDITDATGVTVKASNRAVSLINDTALTFTYGGAAVALIVGDIVTRTGSSAQAVGNNREWTGLGAIIAASGTLYNVDPTVYPVWKSFVDSNAGTNRALSEGLMINAVDQARRQGGNISVILCNLGVRRAYFNLLVQQRKFQGSKEFGGGFTGLTFTTDQGDIPIVTDIAAPYNTMVGITEKELKWYRIADWEFMNRDGSMWDRQAGVDGYTGTMYQYSELGTHRRNAHMVIQDITEG